LDDLVLLLPRDRAGPAAFGLQGEDHVLAHGEVADDALIAPVLGRERDPLRQPVRRRLELGAFTAQRDPPGVRAIGAVEQPGELGAPGSEQPREPDDLAVMDVEIRRLDGAPASEALGGQQGLLGAAIALLLAAVATQGAKRVEVLADHLPDERVAVELAREVLALVPAVAQDREPVADRVDLVEEVRDEEDRDAL